METIKINIADMKFEPTDAPCAICGKSPSLISVNSFIPTCDEHRECHTFFQPNVTQKRLGIIDELPKEMQECFICRNQLTPDELDSILETHFSVTCEKHREVAQFFHRNFIQYWFEFKALNPNANLENSKDLNNYRMFVENKSK